YPAAGNGARGQEGVCTTPTGDTVTFRVNDAQGGSGHGVRVFAGPRWDPFIMDAPAALKTVATRKLALTDPGAINMDGKHVLVLDTSKPYAEQGSFLEIEPSLREGRAHETCGGRAPNDDVMDTIFTLMINGGNGPMIRDGVDQSTRPASHTFPYLTPANPDPPEPPEHH